MRHYSKNEKKAIPCETASFNVGAAGFEPATLPPKRRDAHTGLCYACLFYLFPSNHLFIPLPFICFSSFKASDFVDFSITRITSQSFAFEVKPWWFDRCFLRRASTLILVEPT